jgi:hypothetical protein
LPLAGEHADHAKRLAADPNRGARGIGARAEKLVARHAAKDGKLLGAGDILCSEECSSLHGPRAYRGQVSASALNLGVPVGRLGDDLLPRVHAG